MPPPHYKYPDEPAIASPVPHHCRRFQGRVCLVTASTQGIGLAIACRLAEEGGSVLVSSRKEDQVAKTVAALRARGFDVAGAVCHQAKAEDRRALIEAALQRWGRIDVVVLNAAVQPAPATRATFEVEDGMFDKIFDVNVKSYWQFAKEIYPHVTKPGGAFCFVSSEAAYSPTAPLGLYGISKTTVVGLTKLLAAELGVDGVRVNCIAPGLVRTHFAEMLWKDQQSLAHVERQSYLRRAGEPWEQAGAVAFLCSSDAAYVNGETLLVNGGGGAARL